MLEFFGRLLRQRQGIAANPIYKLAVEVATARIPYDRALAQAQSYQIVSQLADGDLIELDRQAAFEARANLEFGLLLERLTVAAARAKSFEKVYVDLCLNLAAMLDHAHYYQERDYYLNEALQSSQRISYTTGHRRVLNRLARLASLENDDTEARHYLSEQLRAGREEADTREDVGTALMLARAALIDGESTLALDLFQRAGRSSRRLGYYTGVVEALLYQVTILIDRGDLDSARVYLQQADEAAQHTADPRLQGNVALKYAELLRDLNRPTEAIERANAALQFGRSTDDLEMELNSLRILAELERYASSSEDALIHLNELARLERTLGDRSEEGQALVLLAELHIDSREFDDALRALTEAREVAYLTGDPELNIRVHGMLGMVMTAQGHESGALDAFDKAVVESRRIGDQRREANWIIAAGEALLRFRGPEEAQSVIDRARFLSQQLNSDALNAQVLALEGQIALVSGSTSEALTAYGSALSLAREAGDNESVLHYLPILARLSVMDGDSPQAFMYLNQAINLAEHIEDTHRACSFHGQIGRLYQQRDDCEQAIHHYEQAYDLAQELQDHRMMGRALQGIATAYDTAGSIDEAVDYYLRALDETERASDFRSMARIHYNIGAILIDIDRDDEARQHLYRAREVAQRVDDRILEERIRTLLSVIAPPGIQDSGDEDLQLDESPAPPRSLPPLQ